jgi:single-strand DNA-binding protein
MAMSLNRIQVIGNICLDPELRQFENGTYILKFSVVTNREWKKSDGTKESKAEYHRVVLFGDYAEKVSKFMHKGDQVYAEGSMDTTSYTTQEGEKKYKTEILCKQVIVLSCKHREPRQNEDAYDGSYN